MFHGEFMSLATDYKETIAPALKGELGIKNVHALPKLQKITVNVGFGSMRGQGKIAETIAADLARVTGQKPAIRRAKKAVAAFKLRAGEPIGLAVTLRGSKMYNFLERLIRTSLPRIRDFRGLPLTGFDGHGNYTFGMKEHTVFPEIEHDTIAQFYGMSITLTTNRVTDSQAELLLRKLGFPLKSAQ